MGGSIIKSVGKGIGKIAKATGIAGVVGGVLGLGDSSQSVDVKAEITKQLRTSGQSAGKIARDLYVNHHNKYPSNAQIWHLGKGSDDDFDPNLLPKMDFGTSPAPKGKIIFSPFEQIRPGVDYVFEERSRPSAVAFFAGRVFYGGIEANNPDTNLTTGHVFFSQIASDMSRIGKCYQEADPTSEHISDIIDDDGGVIPIAGCGKILFLAPLLSSLVVVATNGIWEISGADAPFSATNYELNQISEFGGITPQYVRYENSVFFLSETDVMMVTPTEGGGLISQSLTEGVINNFFRKIPAQSKLKAVISFDPSVKHLMIIYSKDPADAQRRTEMLAYDFTLQAWYRHSFILPTNAYIASVTYINEALSKLITEDVVVYEHEKQEKVMVGSHPVQVDMNLKINSTPQLRFMIVNGNQYRFAYLRDSNFKDFDIHAYKSYLVTGINTFDDTMRNKQVEYIIPTFKRTEELIDGEVDKESSCLMSIRWDFADSAKSNKWSKPQQVYRYSRYFTPEPGEDFGYGHEVIQTKNKVRGTGKALSFVFESEPGKDLHLYGWAVAMSGRRGI